MKEKQSNESMKNFFSFFGRFIVSILLLWYIFTKIDTQKTWEILANADLFYIFYAAFVFFLIYLILIWRWIILMAALDLKVPLLSAVRYFFIGLFGNLFLPTSIGGDIIKILGLCKETPQKAKVVASVLLDRLSGFAAIVIVAVIFYSAGYRLIKDTAIFATIIAMFFLSILIIFVLFNRRVYKTACQIFNFSPRLKNGLMTMHDDIMLLSKRRKDGFKAIILSCWAQIVFSYVFYLLAKALHQEINLIYFFIFIPLICIASSFPSIGGLGVREAGAAYLFAQVGIDAGVSVSVSLINFLFMVVFGLLGGLFYVVTLFSRRIQCHPSACKIPISSGK